MADRYRDIQLTRDVPYWARLVGELGVEEGAGLLRRITESKGYKAIEKFLANPDVQSVADTMDMLEAQGQQIDPRIGAAAGALNPRMYRALMSRVKNLAPKMDKFLREFRALGLDEELAEPLAYLATRYPRTARMGGLDALTTLTERAQKSKRSLGARRKFFEETFQGADSGDVMDLPDQDVINDIVAGWGPGQAFVDEGRLQKYLPEDVREFVPPPNAAQVGPEFFGGLPQGSRQMRAVDDTAEGSFLPPMGEEVLQDLDLAKKLRAQGEMEDILGPEAEQGVFEQFANLKTNPEILKLMNNPGASNLAETIRAAGMGVRGRDLGDIQNIIPPRMAGLVPRERDIDFLNKLGISAKINEGGINLFGDFYRGGLTKEGEGIRRFAQDMPSRLSFGVLNERTFPRMHEAWKRILDENVPGGWQGATPSDMRNAFLAVKYPRLDTLRSSYSPYMDPYSLTPRKKRGLNLIPEQVFEKDPNLPTNFAGLPSAGIEAVQAMNAPYTNPVLRRSFEDEMRKMGSLFGSGPVLTDTFRALEAMKKAKGRGEKLSGVEAVKAAAHKRVSSDVRRKRAGETFEQAFQKFLEMHKKQVFGGIE